MAMFSSGSQDTVFVRDGMPYRLFVEATSVRERPRLVRQIIKHGGVIVNAARDADLLLAENNTKEALELLEAWKGDKIILGTRWVTSCIDENRFVGADRDWGGYALDRQGLLQGIQQQTDGDSDADLGENEDKMQKISSTPRTKPTSAGRPRKPELESSQSRASKASPFTKRPRGSVSSREHEQRPSSSSSKPHRTPTSQTPSKDPLITSNPASPIEPGPSTLPLPPQAHMQQQVLFSTMFNHLLHQPQHPPMSNFFPSIPSPSLQNFPQFQPLHTPSFSQPNPNQVQLLAQQLLMNPQLREVLDRASFSSPGGQQGGITFPPNANDQDGSTHPMPDAVEIDMSSDVSSAKSEPGEVEIPKPTIKDKGKGRAKSPSHDGEVQRAIKSRPPRIKEPIVSGNRGLFVDSQGSPKTFYIMVDIKSRKDLLKIVKKHGGSMVSEMDQAHYIILNNRSNQFQQVLGTLPVHKIALSPAWLEACDKNASLADLAPFVIDVTSGIGQGAQRKGTSRPKPKETVEYESEEGTLDGPEATTTPIATPVKDTGRPYEHDISGLRSGSRSPSPPTTVVEWVAGRNSFTEDDHKWFFRYARYQLERNPNLGHYALMQAMGRKAPHHSFRSWDSAWRKNWPDEMAALKRELAASQHGAGTTLPTPSATSTSSLSSSATNSSPKQFPHSQSSITASYTPRNTLRDLMYPDDPSPPRSQASTFPPSSTPVSQSSTQASPTLGDISGSRKRKDSSDFHEDFVTVDRQGKRVKAAQDNIVDVDSFPNVWLNNK